MMPMITKPTIRRFYNDIARANLLVMVSHVANVPVIHVMMHVMVMVNHVANVPVIHVMMHVASKRI